MRVASYKHAVRIPSVPVGRNRAFAVLAIFAMLTSAIIGRLFYLQVYEGKTWQQAALSQRLKVLPIEAPRGRILDRRGMVLVDNVTRRTLVAVPSQMGKTKEQEAAGRERVAGLLAPVLGQSKDALLKRFAESEYWVVLQRRLPDDKANAVAALIKKNDLTGLLLQPEALRYYPEGKLAANLLGVVGDDHKGLEGLELYYDEELRGRDGSLTAEVDSRRTDTIGTAPWVRTDPAPGSDVVLTIDAVIQQHVENVLDKAMQTYAPKRALAMVMDVQTGELLAMGQRPTFDPNQWQTAPLDARRNWGISDVVSPGSIFKPITASMAIDSGHMSPTEEIIDNGRYPLPGHTITNWDGGGFGRGTIADAIRTSSNVGFAQIGLKTGKDTFYQYLSRFGLDTSTGIDFPGEGHAVLQDVGAVKPLDLAEMSFGQTLMVTPISMVGALGTVANDGARLRPHLVKQFTRDGKVTPVAPVQVTQAVKPETAQTVRTMMEQVITKGTGGLAAIPGWTVAGKTGTAQEIINGRVSDTLFLCDFAGLVPQPKPRVAIVIMVDQPTKVANLGGIVAAPLFHDIAPFVLHQLGMYSPGENKDKPVETAPAVKPVPVPALVDKPVSDAFIQAAKAGLHLVVEGGGTKVTALAPGPGVAVLPGAILQAKADPPSGRDPGLVYVPDLSATTVRQAADLLDQLGLRQVAIGSGILVKQHPAPGSAVPRGSEIRLTFAP